MKKNIFIFLVALIFSPMINLSCFSDVKKIAFVRDVLTQQRKLTELTPQEFIVIVKSTDKQLCDFWKSKNNAQHNDFIDTLYKYQTYIKQDIPAWHHMFTKILPALFKSDSKNETVFFLCKYYNVDVRGPLEKLLGCFCSCCCLVNDPGYTYPTNVRSIESAEIIQPNYETTTQKNWSLSELYVNSPGVVKNTSECKTITFENNNNYSYNDVSTNKKTTDDSYEVTNTYMNVVMTTLYNSSDNGY